jgi:hypothetical protein
MIIARFINRNDLRGAMMEKIGVYSFIILMLGICGLLFFWVVASFVSPESQQSSLTGATTGAQDVDTPGELFHENPVLFLLTVVALPLGLLFFGIGMAQSRGHL